MTRESIAFLVSGTMFGVLIGWLIGSQQPGTRPAPAPVAAQAQAAQPAPAPPVLDTQRAAELERSANADPANAAARVELGDLYFNAERFDQAIPWYEAALKLNPKNVNVSTDLGVCYYSTQQDDRALAQFDRSLAIDPNHVKTLFNQGVVRAFGKQDLPGATESWQRVIALAPQSEEGKRAKQIIDGLQSGHAGQGAAAPAPAAPPAPPAKGK